MARPDGAEVCIALSHAEDTEVGRADQCGPSESHREGPLQFDVFGRMVG